RHFILGSALKLQGLIVWFEALQNVLQAYRDKDFGYNVRVFQRLELYSQEQQTAFTPYALKPLPSAGKLNVDPVLHGSKNKSEFDLFYMITELTNPLITLSHRLAFVFIGFQYSGEYIT
ncbi:hypothetical protein L9F63_002346, partial [Diploptera punctata]